MIEIKVRVRDNNNRWQYKKYIKDKDTPINSSEIEQLLEYIADKISKSRRPEISYNISYNKYFGCIAGMGGSWVPLINKEKGQSIIERIISDINVRVEKNKNSLNKMGVEADY